MKKIYILLLIVFFSCSTTKKISKNMGKSQEHNTYKVENNLLFKGHSKYRTADGPVVLDGGAIYFNSVDKIFYLDLDHKITEVFSLDNGVFSGMELDKENNLYAIDYKNHRIFFFKNLEDIIDFSSPKIILKNDKFFQPNDMAITSDGDFLFVDADWKKDKIGILWFAPRDGSNPVKLYEIDQPLIGISYDEIKGHIYLATAGKDHILRCKFDSYEKKCREIKKIKIGQSRWGLDGMSINPKTHEIFVSRINKRKIDIYSSNLEYKKSICLSQDGDCSKKGELKGLASKPSDITFDNKNNRLIITHFGDRKLKGYNLEKGKDRLDVYKSHLQIIELEQ